MKIAININELTLEHSSGVKAYTGEIVNALEEIDREDEYVLYCCKSPLSFCPTRNFRENFKLKISKSFLPFWTYSALPREIKKDKPDVLFMPIQTVPFLLKPKNIKIVVTVHDLAFVLFPDYFTPKDRFLLNFHTKRAVAMADRIIVPSCATKNDLIKLYRLKEENIADKINVIYHGVSTEGKMAKPSDFKAESDTAAKKKLERYKPYLLFVGAIQPRKNLARLIEAFETVKTKNKEFQNLKLVICGGKGWMADKVFRRARKSRFTKDIIFTGDIGEYELASLYQNALLFVMPSLYEGFGFPVLEAMSFGIPCIAGDNSSLKEIANDDAVLVNALSSDDIAEKINFLLKNSAVRENFSQRAIKRSLKFSWLKSAKKHLEVFHRLSESCHFRENGNDSCRTV